MRVIGLMSGTSADGIDAALVRVGRRGVGLAVRLEAFRHVAYPPAVRRRLLAAVIGLCRRSRTPLAAIDLVGCHGHTLHHDPARGRVTIQIGEAALVAVRTGITTLADFRPADVGAGGGGGSANPTLLAMLRQRLPGVTVRVSDALGMPGNVPAATGSVRPLVLGKIVPGENYERVILRTRRR